MSRSGVAFPLVSAALTLTFITALRAVPAYRTAFVELDVAALDEAISFRGLETFGVVARAS